MQTAKDYDEAIGLADWLFDNTTLTLEQIAKYARVGMQTAINISNGVAADAINQISPIEKDWLSQTDIDRCQLDPDTILPKSTLRDEAFNLCLIPDGEYLNNQELFHSVGLASVAFITYGRNAWHSTWIKRYYLKGSVQPNLKWAKKTAETWRKSGSVLNIDKIPAVFLRSNKRIVFIVEINSGGHMKRFAEMCQEAVDATDVLPMLGYFEANTLLFLEEQCDWFFRDASDIKGKTWNTYKAKPRGSGHTLCWEKSLIAPEALPHAKAVVRTFRNLVKA